MPTAREENLHHILMVNKMLHVVVFDLLHRASFHDATKLEEPEASAFEKVKPLHDIMYDSEEYREQKRLLGDALAHHYARNRHHPEHYPDGIDGMNLIDLIEMFCDWKASSLRHRDGNLLKSIEANATRFGIGPQLLRILKNTASLIDGVRS